MAVGQRTLRLATRPLTATLSRGERGNCGATNWWKDASRELGAGLRHDEKAAEGCRSPRREAGYGCRTALEGIPSPSMRTHALRLRPAAVRTGFTPM